MKKNKVIDTIWGNSWG